MPSSSCMTGLDAAGINHAFGGAFALLWCTGEPRTTIDIDLNIFVRPSDAKRVLDVLPDEIEITDDQVTELMAAGQCRLMFDGIPVDIFSTRPPSMTTFVSTSTNISWPTGTSPFLGCNDLAVFKAFFNRRKDWADIEAMLLAGRLDVPYVTGILTDYLGPGDERVHQLLAVRDEAARAVNR